MRILASDIAHAVDGELIGADAAVDGAGFDSRNLMPGQLFVAIVAERDGHDFIPAAIAAGATAFLASERSIATAHADRAAAIVVPDTAAALMKLAAFARQRLEVPTIGVTGSVGKTSTKDMIACALGATRRVTANEMSFNNEMGLPVTVLAAPDEVEALVLEMGMRGFGEITRLVEVAQPTIGVVTSVAASHTGRVGGITGVAIAKRELVEALPPTGTAILNADDTRVAAMRYHTAATVVTYGNEGDIRVSNLRLDDLARPSFDVATPWGGGQVRLAISGAHMASNAAAAIAVAGVVEGSIDRAIEALVTATVAGRRMQIERTASGALIVNDSYNANPGSTDAGLAAIAAMAAQRRYAVLGPMGELDDEAAGHAAVAATAADLGITVIPVGTDLYGATPVGDGTTSDSAIAAAVTALGPLAKGDVVLVKASFAAQLWRVTDYLMAQ